MIRATGVPRLTPLTIRRPRLERWLEAYSQYPVRLLVAPPGSGKTSVVLKYCAESGRNMVYHSMPRNADAQYVRRTFGKLLTASPAQCCEIIVDEIDNACPEGLEELAQLVEGAPENVSLVYIARSRECMDVQRLVARGVAALCDAHRLAFDVEETARLAEACGVSATDLDVRRLLEDSDGWALAVSSAIRTASAERLTIDRGYQLWRSHSQTVLREFVAAEVQRAPEDLQRTFWAVYEGTGRVDVAQLRELEVHGMFVIGDGRDSLRLLRPLASFGVRPAVNAGPSATTAPLMVRMFRSFEARIEGREIPWVRRRDQQIVKYLLLKPNGTASRQELASVFWSDTDRHLATQSVRTACSTIRKAFASIVGPANVDLYFRTTPELQIDLKNVVCDVRRFIAHVNDGDADFERGDIEDAAMHYRACEKLYAGNLLEFDAAEPWIVAQGAALSDRFMQVLERLGTLAVEREEVTTAAHYLHRAQAISSEHPVVARLAARLDRIRDPKKSARPALAIVS
ncbi:MAG TPA: BTAD domain-containing putative transcriptional regulator [Candidatus Baltobacteraceae bacterium]|nr:BTAD domain-containing putative transcriptional regulator [Candidatus Baltobacteraceae bacterium]